MQVLPRHRGEGCRRTNASQRSPPGNTERSREHRRFAAGSRLKLIRHRTEVDAGWTCTAACHAIAGAPRTTRQRVIAAVLSLGPRRPWRRSTTAGGSTVSSSGRATSSTLFFRRDNTVDDHGRVSSSVKHPLRGSTSGRSKGSARQPPSGRSSTSPAVLAERGARGRIGRCHPDSDSRRFRSSGGTSASGASSTGRGMKVLHQLLEDRTAKGSRRRSSRSCSFASFAGTGLCRSRSASIRAAPDFIDVAYPDAKHRDRARRTSGPLLGRLRSSATGVDRTRSSSPATPLLRFTWEDVDERWPDGRSHDPAGAGRIEVDGARRLRQAVGGLRPRTHASARSHRHLDGSRRGGTSGSATASSTSARERAASPPLSPRRSTRTSTPSSRPPGCADRRARSRTARCISLAGKAEAIPLPDASVDLAWLSNVDPPLRRPRAGGARTATSDQRNRPHPRCVRGSAPSRRCTGSSPAPSRSSIRGRRCPR